MFVCSLAYEGPPSALHIRAKSFLALSPITTTLTADIPYDQLYRALGFNKEAFFCGKNVNQGLAGVSLPRWDIAGLQKAYAVFADLTADPRFTRSFLLLENYGMVAVTGVDPASTSLPPEERERPILATAVIHYESDEETTRRDASTYQEAIKTALYEGLERSEWHAYVNYAKGDESTEEVYGREEWRVEKLRALKEVWDPQNRFRFFAPLV